MAHPNAYRHTVVVEGFFNVKIWWSCLMWAYSELLRLYTNVWVEAINIGTLVVKGLT